jgi:integrase
MLIVRESKFRKTRLVPAHASVVDRLRQYQEARDRVHPAPLPPAFFVSERGRRLPYSTVGMVFRRLCKQIGLHGSATARGPRIHDLRHNAASGIMPIRFAG